MLSRILKNNIIYKKVYLPYITSKRKEENKRKHEIFVKEGYNALQRFVECMNAEGLNYWLEFGTLLGAYRDGAFVPNELDLDVGVHLRDAKKIYDSMLRFGFTLVREFHVVGENGLEQTYGYKGTTIDLMYFYEDKDMLWCNGSVISPKFKKGKCFDHKVTSHHFKKFETKSMTFLGLNVSIPANTEEHLIEIFGEGYRVYDPNFKGDLNKHYYSLQEKRGIGFIIS